LNNLNGIKCCEQLAVIFDLFPEKMNLNVFGKSNKYISLLNTGSKFMDLQMTALHTVCHNDGRHKRGGLDIFTFLVDRLDKSVVEECVTWKDDVCFCCVVFQEIYVCLVMNR